MPAPTPTPKNRAEELQFILVQPRMTSAILGEVDADSELPPDVLREKVVYGREQQQELTREIRHAKQHGAESVIDGLTDRRRLYHIGTILARAELLARGKKSVSLYDGDERLYDEQTILERAIGFLELKASETTDADDRERLLAKCEIYRAIESAITKALDES